jgi:hypothetical protein
MKIFKALASGFCRTLKAWKGIILIWFGSLLMVSLVALPLKGLLKSGFGGSMITERLQDGLDIEVLGDLGSVFRGVLASLPAGLLLLLLIGIVLYAFLSGGIFDSLRSSASKFSGNQFFSACARNFWPFFVISLIISAIILMLFVIVLILPISIVTQSGSGSETAPVLIVKISAVIFLFLTIIFILVADYARAWQAANDRSEGFRAIGFGFTRTFGRLLSSFPMMLILVAVAILFTSLVIYLIGRWTPDSGGGVFLLFLVSQILFFIKSGLKVWRYGSVTELKEINDIKEQKTDTVVNPIIEV